MAIDAEALSGVVNMLTFADAGEDVEQLLLFRLAVTDAVRGDERQPVPPRECDQHLIAVLFFADVMPLQLDMRPPLEDAGDFFQRVFIIAGEATQPLRVLL